MNKRRVDHRVGCSGSNELLLLMRFFGRDECRRVDALEQREFGERGRRVLARVQAKLRLA